MNRVFLLSPGTLPAFYLSSLQLSEPETKLVCVKSVVNRMTKKISNLDKRNGEVECYDDLARRETDRQPEQGKGMIT